MCDAANALELNSVQTAFGSGISGKSHRTSMASAWTVCKFVHVRQILSFFAGYNTKFMKIIKSPGRGAFCEKFSHIQICLVI